MMQSNLQHMYQAWQQGNDRYVQDWANFVEWAAKLNNTSNDNIMRELQTCRWFKRPSE